MARVEAADAEEASSQKEYHRAGQQLRIVGAVAISVLLVGTIFYHAVEKLHWLDSVYFCTITLATIGYGDIVPHTDIGKLFTIFYALSGIGILATFAHLVLRRTILRREIRHPSRKTKRQ